ncbi:universal stress protein [Phenylobacterium sp. J367]|uniref:universal stress protein n=1 Tax=Phenylobacterium sp. J367 TaxID=2898435 RepID=UPI002151D7C6|nr:universal stress protein [Phenylobacterium sp. J367]MCR5879274.1 universal stress protein [Phenylobacterium sp. J367]
MIQARAAAGLAPAAFEGRLAMTQARDQTTLNRPARTGCYDCVLVHVEPGLASSRRTEVAAGLAKRFGARLIGLEAETVEPIPVADPYGAEMTAQVFDQLAHEVDANLERAEESFRRDGAEADGEWRAARMAPADALVLLSRAADLIVMGAGSPPINAFRVADPAEVVLRAGKPVLVAPADPPAPHPRAVVIAWKDTRESRRAVADALPLLADADDVVVMSVCTEAQVDDSRTSTQDVVDALRRRGVPARAHVVTAPDGSVADELNAEAAAIGANLIVAGAYGHSRLAEWVFGGVTRALLSHPTRYLLLSH